MTSILLRLVPAPSLRSGKLERLWQACFPVTAILTLLWLVGSALIILGLLSGWTLLGVSVMVSLVPLAIALHWLIQIPHIWGINPSWVGLFLLVVTAAFALYGNYSAGLILNEHFHESPGTFPIAYALGSYFTAVIGLMTVLTASAFFLLFLTVDVFLVCALIRWQFSPGVLIYPVLVLLTGFSAGVIPHLRNLTESSVIMTAIKADFFPSHHCQRDTWPKGIKRVAFLGDEQVLGYADNSNAIMILPCKRKEEPIRAAR